MSDRDKVIDALESAYVENGVVNRATEYLPRCFGVYSDISCGNCPYRRYEKEGRGCTYALHEDALTLLKEQEQRIKRLEHELGNVNFK